MNGKEGARSIDDLASQDSPKGGPMRRVWPPFTSQRDQQPATHATGNYPRVRGGSLNQVFSLRASGDGLGS
jgi:hypothetical protein